MDAYAKARETFDSLLVGDDFTSQMLMNLAGIPYTKENAKKVHMFIGNRRQSKQIGIKGNKGKYSLYEKILDEPQKEWKRKAVTIAEPKPEVKVEKKERLMDKEMDCLTVGKSILLIIQDQAKRITGLKEELKHWATEQGLWLDREHHLKTIIDQQAEKINELNQSILSKDKRPMTLHELKGMVEGLPVKE